LDRTTFLYGCRSGIQKAVRRGDIPLGLLCFDSLWEDTTHRPWLLGRLSSIVVEDCWTMAAELAKAEAAYSDADTEETFEVFRKFYIKLCMAVKNQDAAALTYIKDMGRTSSRHKEFVTAMRILDNWEGLSEFALMNLVAEAIPREQLNEYEQLMLGALVKRFNVHWGDYERKFAALAVALLFSRGITEKTISDMLTNQAAKYKGEPLSPAKELPWYVFDMHTRPGKMASAAFVKHANKLGLTKEVFENFWFCAESMVVPERVIPQSVTADNVSALEQRWTGQAREDTFALVGMSLQEAMLYWEQTMLKDVRKMVEWGISKQNSP